MGFKGYLWAFMLCSFRTYYSGDKTVPESHRMFQMWLCHIYTFNYLQYYKILYIILYFPILILLFLIYQRNFIVKSCNFSQNFHRCFVYIFFFCLHKIWIFSHRTSVQNSVILIPPLYYRKRNSIWNQQATHHMQLILWVLHL